MPCTPVVEDSSGSDVATVQRLGQGALNHTTGQQLTTSTHIALSLPCASDAESSFGSDVATVQSVVCLLVVCAGEAGAVLNRISIFFVCQATGDELL